MDGLSTKSRQEYKDGLKVIESNINDISDGTAPKALYDHTQTKLDKLAKQFQDNEELGPARYKLYELQALLFYYQNRDAEALDFIQQAIEIKGKSYKRADTIMEQINLAPRIPTNPPAAGYEVTADPGELPLKLQSLIKGMRSAAIVMAVISVISIYFIPWAIFYIILASKLRPDELPNRKLVTGAFIATLPLCMGLIPIIINIEFWRMRRHLIEYEEQGALAFISDEDFLAGEPSRKKGNKIAWSILASFIAILIILIVYTVASGNLNSVPPSSTSSSMEAKPSISYTSIEHGFVVSFPGHPEIERQTIQESGHNIPYTLYTSTSADGNAGYAMGVYDFTGIEIDETGALEGGVNGAVQGTEGATLVESDFSTFLGLKSINGHYTAPSGDARYDVFMKGFIRNGKMYLIFTAGAEKADFYQYVNSFSFT